MQSSSFAQPIYYFHMANLLDVTALWLGILDPPELLVDPISLVKN